MSDDTGVGRMLLVDDSPGPNGANPGSSDFSAISIARLPGQIDASYYEYLLTTTVSLTVLSLDGTRPQPLKAWLLELLVTSSTMRQEATSQSWI